jgi:hypothetical protein
MAVIALRLAWMAGCAIALDGIVEKIEPVLLLCGELRLSLQPIVVLAAEGVKRRILGFVRRQCESQVLERGIRIVEDRLAIDGREHLQRRGRIAQAAHHFRGVLIRHLERRDERLLCLRRERRCAAVSEEAAGRTVGQ